MTVKRQEMAAIICVYDSGEFDVVSCHYTHHDAVEELEFLRDNGYTKDWYGTLIVVGNNTVHAEVNVEKLQNYVAALNQKS